MARFRGFPPPLKHRRGSESRPLVTLPSFPRRHWIASALLVVVLLLGIGYLVLRYSAPTCGRGMTVTGKQSAECVGVTDGDASLPADLGLQAVLRKIKEQNDDVLRRGEPFVSIGYVVPLPIDATSGLLTALRHELEGAYLAQWRANHHDEGLGDTPLIRLLVVNVGDQARYQDTVIPEVIRRVADPADHLVAVAGLGQSLESTKQAIRSLSEAGIPMIASRLTADDLGTTPGQARPGTVPDLPHQQHGDRPRGPGAQTRDDTAGRGHQPGRRLHRLAGRAVPQGLRHPSDGHAARTRALRLLTARGGQHLRADDAQHLHRTAHCDLLRRAGREPLRLPCCARRATLPPTEDRPVQRRRRGRLGRGLAPATRRRGPGRDRHQPAREHHLPLHRARPSRRVVRHPAVPACRYQDPPAGLRHLLQPDLPQEGLDDGAAIVSYDAVLVAISAIRSGVGQHGSAPGGPDALTPGSVLQQMFRIDRAQPVNGTSGPIAFDDHGKPVGKLIPILQLNPDGTVTFSGLG